MQRFSGYLSCFCMAPKAKQLPVVAAKQLYIRLSLKQINRKKKTHCYNVCLSLLFIFLEAKGSESSMHAKMFHIS